MQVLAHRRTSVSPPMGSDNCMDGEGRRHSILTIAWRHLDGDCSSKGSPHSPAGSGARGFGVQMIHTLGHDTLETVRQSLPATRSGSLHLTLASKDCLQLLHILPGMPQLDVIRLETNESVPCSPHTHTLGDTLPSPSYISLKGVPLWFLWEAFVVRSVQTLFAGI